MTADTFLNEHHQISHFYDKTTKEMVVFDFHVKVAMIEFAKLHVKAALEAAADSKLAFKSKSLQRIEIENSYPLENIK